MDIIVCIKQVPDTTEVKINPETNTLIREGVPSIVNPFDENAIEAALQLRQAHGGKVTAITMGPPQAKDALKHVLAMGVDEVILISDRAFAGSDTLATSYTLSQAIRKIGKFDLIICGKQAIDGDTAQVGPGIAEWLNIPQVTFAVKIEVDGKKLKVERLLEDTNEIVAAPLPCMLTVVKQINEPRPTSLKGMMKAKKAEIKTWGSQAVEADEMRIGLNGSPTWVVKIFTPPPKSGGKVYYEDIDNAVSEVAAQIKERSLA